MLPPGVTATPTAEPWRSSRTLVPSAQTSAPLDAERLRSAGCDTPPTSSEPASSTSPSSVSARRFATNHPCQLHGGNRYIVPGEPNPDAFECIARVGYLGPDTPMRDALFAAVQPEINGTGGCNEGFLRPDALLVVTLIFDSQDVKSWRTPKKVRDAVVAAKGGDPNAVVMAVVTWPTTNEAEKPGCTFTDLPDPLKELAALFPYHVIGDACADDYTPYLELAAEKVSEACGKFIPQ